MANKPDPWQTWLDQLPTLLRQQLKPWLQPPPENSSPPSPPHQLPPPSPDFESQTFSQQLPEDVRQKWLAGFEPAEPPLALHQPYYYLVECEEGELPRLNKFKTPRAVAERLQKLADRDMAAIAFYGHFLPFSTGPIRYLFTAQGWAWSIPPVGAIQEVPLYPDDVALQEDFYLGPIEMVVSTRRHDETEEVEEEEEDFPPTGPPDSEEDFEGQ